MSYSSTEIQKRFASLIEDIQGDPNASFDTVSAIETATGRSLVFASEEKFLEMALKGPAPVVVIKKGLLKEPVKGKTFLLTKNVGLAQSRITTEIMGRHPKNWKPGIHLQAVIAPSAKLGAGCYVGPFAVIGENCVIGEGCYIGPHAIIDNGAVIGEKCVFWGQNYVGPLCKIGNRVVLHPQNVIGAEGYGFAKDEKGRHNRIPQNGIVVLCDDVDIGSHVNIDRAVFQETRVGRGSKIDAYIHIGHNVTIGEDCLLTAGAMIGGSSHLGNNVVTGGRTTVTDHIRVGNNVHVAGLSGVAKTVEVGGGYGGYPLQPIKDHLKTTATLVHLPEIRKNVALLMKKVFGEDSPRLGGKGSDE